MRRSSARISPVVLGALALLALPVALSAEPLTETMHRMLADEQPAEPLAPQHEVLCVGGMAGAYPCSNVDLLELMPLSSLGGATGGNDIWGWTDPKSAREFALVGLRNGTAFVEITDPENAIYLGRLPSAGNGNSTWRDIKVHADHAFVVSDFNGCHGMQVFDLVQLLDVENPPVTFTVDAHYTQIGSAHNLAINEETGFAYIVGGSSGGSCSGINNCAGGLHMVNIQNPHSPTFAGCFSADGYTHDTQCVSYTGPDTDYVGHEICVSSNEDTVTVTDVTNKAAPVQVSRTPYPGNGYTHQGWFTEDRHYFLVDDELDESDFGHNTYTYVWNVQNLDAPQLLGHFTSPTPAIDHNQYVKGSFVFQANYRSGLRILRLDDPATATLTQVGYFDIYPANDSPNFNGAWSVYPYFPSGNIVVNGIEQGLFVLRPNLCTVPAAPTGLDADPAGDQQIQLDWTGSGTPENTFSVERALGGCSGMFEEIASGLESPSFLDTTASGQVTYGYRVRERDESGFCASEYSACVTGSTTGPCTAPPLFAGLQSATNGADPSCRVELAWAGADPLCGESVTYNVYRGSDELFLPEAANRIASGVVGHGYFDLGAPSGVTSHYIVRAVDPGSLAEESNLARHSTAATGPPVDGTFTTGAEIGEPPLDTIAPPAGSPEAPEHAGWHPTETRKHTGLRSFGSGAAASACITLEGDFDLTAGQSSQLSFWHFYVTEPGYDGGILQLSTNGGGNWTQLTPSGGYPSSITQSGNACAALTPGTPAFVGSTPAWGQRFVSLAPWAGQSVRIAWRYGTDTAVTEEGWYVDDIALTHTQVPSSCENNGLFLDGFESEDTSGWSATVPPLP